MQVGKTPCLRKAAPSATVPPRHLSAQQMQVGKTPCLRKSAPSAAVPPRHRSAQQMQVGKTPCLRKSAPSAAIPPRHRSAQQMQVGKTPCLRTVAPSAAVPPRHRSVTGEIKAPRFPHGRRGNRVPRPQIASRPARQRREVLCEGRHGRGRQLRQQLLERRQRLARRPPQSECLAAPRRPGPTTLPPAPARMMHTIPTLRQST